jgi:hypothetical protein
MNRIQKLIDFVRGGKTSYDEVTKLNLTDAESKIIESKNRENNPS